MHPLKSPVRIMNDFDIRNLALFQTVPHGFANLRLSPAQKSLAVAKTLCFRIETAIDDVHVFMPLVIEATDLAGLGEVLSHCVPFLSIAPIRESNIPLDFFFCGPPTIDSGDIFVSSCGLRPLGAMFIGSCC